MIEEALAAAGDAMRELRAVIVLYVPVTVLYLPVTVLYVPVTVLYVSVTVLYVPVAVLFVRERRRSPRPGTP